MRRGLRGVLLRRQGEIARVIGAVGKGEVGVELNVADVVEGCGGEWDFEEVGAGDGVPVVAVAGGKGEVEMPLAEGDSLMVGHEGAVGVELDIDGRRRLCRCR